MAAYTTPEAVRAVLSRDSTNVGATASTLDEGKILTAIADATSQVDAALVQMYIIPFDPDVPALVSQITRDIAAYDADLVYRQNKDYSSNLDPVYLRYRKASNLLDQLRQGTIDLPGATHLTGSAGIAVANPYSGSLFVSDEFDLQRGPLPQYGPPWDTPW